jgi:hypothetical protein
MASPSTTKRNPCSTTTGSFVPHATCTAQVVRPSSLIVNVMGPMRDGGTHVDAPTFRGLERGVAPLWLLVIMGMSRLFERWAVRVAGGLTWFYDRSDGQFEYRPNGIDAPSEMEIGPYGNVALMADNELTRQDKTAPKFLDRLRRDFTASAPNVKW